MERLIPIHVLEYSFRRHGMFFLVDPKNQKLWFYGFRQGRPAVQKLMDELKGRSKEMGNFLISRASIRGKTA